jgi:hypothetical protein
MIRRASPLWYSSIESLRWKRNRETHYREKTAMDALQNTIERFQIRSSAS